MQIVILTALGVGGATLIGAIIGFLFKNISHKFSDVVISFAAGVMLCAAVTGLILPSLESGTLNSLVVCIVGIFAGALVIHIFDKAVPHLLARLIRHLRFLWQSVSHFKISLKAW